MKRGLIPAALVVGALALWTMHAAVEVPGE